MSNTTTYISMNNNNSNGSNKNNNELGIYVSTYIKTLVTTNTTWMRERCRSGSTNNEHTRVVLYVTIGMNIPWRHANSNDVKYTSPSIDR